MSFGGLAPMPMRLGSASDTSISPEQWLRLATDAVSINTPLAVLLVTEVNDNTCTVSGLYRGGTDAESIFSASWATGETVETVRILMPYTYTDSNGTERHWKPTNIIATPVGSDVDLAYSINDSTPSAGNHVIAVQYLTAERIASMPFLVVIWGEEAPRYAGDYGADPDKKKALLEGDVPYAYGWLLESRNTRGDAFSIAEGSFPEMENRARARAWAYCQRLNERHAANALPLQSDQGISRWAELLEIGTSDLRDWELRRKAAAMFALSITGPTEASLTAAAEAVFRHNFVTIHRYPGTLDSPPPNTFWPPGPVGPGALSLDSSGPWTSTRYHLVIELSADTEAEKVRVLGVAHRDFDELLGTLTPVSTWEYSFSAPGNFILGTSELGRDSL